MRFLFTAFFHGLGHVVRTLAVARRLSERGHDVTLACSAHAHDLFDPGGVRLAPLSELPPYRPDQIPAAGARSRFADPGYLTTCLAQEAELVAQLRPDAVVFDFRAVSAIVAAQAGVPSVQITNAHALATFFPRMLHEVELSLAELGIAEALRHRLLGDHVVIADLSRFEPLHGLPADIFARIARTVQEVRHVGPLLRRHPGELPAKSELRPRFASSGRSRLVYATAGGTAMGAAMLETIADVLGQLDDVETVLAIGPHLPPERFSRRPGLVVHPFIERSIELMKAADLAIVHGGHSTVWEGLLAGTPMICVPAQAEQLANAARVVSLGVGLCIPADELARQLSGACDRVLSDPDIAARARARAAAWAAIDGVLACCQFLESLA